MPMKDTPARLLAASYPLRFTTRVLYADMDAFRHLNNGATGRYFEEGRADLNIQVFGTGTMTNPPEGQQLLFASSTIDFLAQAHYPGSVELMTGIARIGTSSWTVAQAAFQNGICFALAEGVMVKASNGRPAPLTAAERTAMARLILKSEPGAPV